MTHRKIRTALALAACLALAGAAHARQPRLTLNGRVVLESAEQKAQPRFTVRLYYPKASNRPTLVTYTNAAGDFSFADVEAGRYMLEVYHGDAMVYQKVLNIDGNSRPLVITLKAGG
ncbi:MAG: hypothetical protein ABW250_23525, partial [Pyrinomonadaceae bacterium]